ncbi:hypothetical protein ACFL5O_02945 [Myxococcota bacterium]
MTERLVGSVVLTVLSVGLAGACGAGDVTEDGLGADSMALGQGVGPGSVCGSTMASQWSTSSVLGIRFGASCETGESSRSDSAPSGDFTSGFNDGSAGAAHPDGPTSVVNGPTASGASVVTPHINPELVGEGQSWCDQPYRGQMCGSQTLNDPNGCRVPLPKTCPDSAFVVQQILVYLDCQAVPPTTESPATTDSEDWDAENLVTADFEDWGDETVSDVPEPTVNWTVDTTGPFAIVELQGSFCQRLQAGGVTKADILVVWPPGLVSGME